MSGQLGHGVSELQDLAAAFAKAKGITFGQALDVLSGKATHGQMIGALGKGLNTATFGMAPKTVGRFAGGKIGRGLARVIPGLSIGMAALDAGDIITNDTSLGNKAMDTAAMGIGGTIGGILGGGVLSVPAAAAGASTGKFVSDGLQYLFGDKKTPEQRRLEEALAMLQGGRY